MGRRVGLAGGEGEMTEEELGMGKGLCGGEEFGMEEMAMGVDV